MPRRNRFLFHLVFLLITATSAAPLHANKFEDNFPDTIPPKDFLANLKDTHALLQKQLGNRQEWVQERCNLDNDLEGFERGPYVQAALVPAKSSLIVMGDIHGDHNALKACLCNLYQNNQIDETLTLKKHQYLIFTGDYTDRGADDIKVWYTFFKLKQQNPNRIFLLRGNHEDYEMAKVHGFEQRLLTYVTNHKKHGRSVNFSLIKLFISSLFELLPHALFLSTSKKKSPILMFCHGGIEVSFDPWNIIHHVQTQNHKRSKTWAFQRLRLPKGNTFFPPLSGFLWNDFIATIKDEKIGSYASARGPRTTMHSHKFAKNYLKEHDLYAIIRGHQHVPGGVALLKNYIDTKDNSTQSILSLFDPALLDPTFFDPQIMAGLSDEIGSDDSWIPLPGKKRSKIKQFSVYTCTTTPSVFGKNLANPRGSYALIKSNSNQWYLTPHYTNLSKQPPISS